MTSISGAGKAGSVLAEYADQMRDGGLRRSRWRRDQRAAELTWAPAARRAFYRRVWQEAADAVGAEMHVLDGDYLSFSRDGSCARAWYQEVELDGALTLRLALDKRVVHRLLRAAKIPVPKHVAFRRGDRGAAIELLRAAEACVVKPCDGTAGGEGVTCGVRSENDLDRAAVHAFRHGNELLIEEQAAGDEYRFLFLDGQLLDVVKRRSPHLVGDGTSTILELIASENEARAEARGARGLNALTVDLDCLLTLRQAGLSLMSVPEVGRAVQIKFAVNQGGPDDCEAVDRTTLSDELVAACGKAISLIGLQFGSVELRTTDPTRPLANSDCVIFDVNGTPGLQYHYLVRNRDRAQPVAVPLLEFLLQGSKRRPRRPCTAPDREGGFSES